jgi:hypothetical protein
MEAMAWAAAREHLHWVAADWQVGQMTKKSQCKKFCRFSGLKKNNAPGLPKKCRKGCK